MLFPYINLSFFLFGHRLIWYQLSGAHKWDLPTRRLRARTPCARTPCTRAPCARAPCARAPCADMMLLLVLGSRYLNIRQENAFQKRIH
ncbi:hypothetical protein FKM82_020047 [Ascaphus truei]